MMKKILILIGMVCFLPIYSYANEPIYQMDGHDANWTAFHYIKPNHQVDFCFTVSNDLTLGFKSNQDGVGLQIWDKQGKQIANSDKKVALTVGQQHFIFQMKAMDKNMLMNRMDKKDFEKLLQALSYAQNVVVEYGQSPVSVVDLSGLPNMLAKFHQCIISAGFADYK